MLDLYPSRLIWAEDERTNKEKERRRRGKRALHKIDFVTSINQSHFLTTTSKNDSFRLVCLFYVKMECLAVLLSLIRFISCHCRCLWSVDFSSNEKICTYTKLYKRFRLPVGIFFSFRSLEYNGKCLHAKVIRIYEMYNSLWRWEREREREKRDRRNKMSKFEMQTKIQMYLDRNSARITVPFILPSIQPFSTGFRLISICKCHFNNKLLYIIFHIAYDISAQRPYVHRTCGSHVSQQQALFSPPLHLISCFPS